MVVDLQLFNLWYGVPIIVHVLNQVYKKIFQLNSLLTQEVRGEANMIA